MAIFPRSFRSVQFIKYQEMACFAADMLTRDVVFGLKRPPVGKGEPAWLLGDELFQAGAGTRTMTAR
jgi:hypothetical protein